jgi:hypothetical protein
MTHPFITEEAVGAAQMAHCNSIRKHYGLAAITYVPPITSSEIDAIDATILAALPHIEKAIRADERDECERALYVLLDAKTADEKEAIRNQAIWDCAAAIRARKE